MAGKLRRKTARVHPVPKLRLDLRGISPTSLQLFLKGGEVLYGKRDVRIGAFSARHASKAEALRLTRRLESISEGFGRPENLLASSRLQGFPISLLGTLGIFRLERAEFEARRRFSRDPKLVLRGWLRLEDYEQLRRQPRLRTDLTDLDIEILKLFVAAGPEQGPILGKEIIGKLNLHRKSPFNASAVRRRLAAKPLSYYLQNRPKIGYSLRDSHLL